MKSVLFTTLFLAATSVFAQETPNATVQDTIKKPKTNELQEVTIAQQRKFMKIESDKTTIAVKHWKCV